jgi:hypothetical protein
MGWIDGIIKYLGIFGRVATNWITLWKLRSCNRKMGYVGASTTLTDSIEAQQPMKDCHL